MVFGFFRKCASTFVMLGNFRWSLPKILIFFDHLRILPQKYESGVKFKKKCENACFRSTLVRDHSITLEIAGLGVVGAILACQIVFALFFGA